MLHSFISDTRFALRLLRKSPLFTVTAALSLAIGIGANATIFSVGSAMLLRPMPGIEGADRLADIGRHRGNDEFDTVSFPNYKDIRDRATSFSGIYAYLIEPTPLSLGGAGTAERVYGTLVTGNFFDVLGVRPHLGRMLRPDDDNGAGMNAVTVLSHDLWMRRFESDPHIVGRHISINGFPFAVVGVAPAGFQGTTVLKGDLWVPLSMLAQARPGMRHTMFTSRESTWLVMGGRLRPGVTLQQANAELGAIAQHLEREHRDTNEGMRFMAHPAAPIPGVSRIVAAFLGLLFAIVTVLLLIACVNLAGMLLARGAARSREVAVRLAIGAGQGRIVRQLLTETAVLFIAGALAGLVLSRWLTNLLLSVLPQLPVPLFVEISTDWRVVTFTVITAAIASILCGLAPALQARRTNLVSSLKADVTAGRAARLRLRNAFVVGQITLSLVLLIAAGLFIRALNLAASTPTGFDQAGVEVVALDLALGRYEAETGRAFARDLLERTRSLPQVETATIAADLPLDGGTMGFGRIVVPGAPGGNSEGEITADWNVVEPGFFRTLGMRLVRGRDFASSDTASAPAVAIVNEAFVRAAWPDRDPIGQRITVDTEERPGAVTVVGVAADARFRSLGEPARPYVLAPLAQLYHGRINLVVKTAGRSAIPDIRALVARMNPNLPVTEAMPLSEVTALGTIPQRIAGAMSGTLGIVGLMLAAIGIYGVTSYSVSQRTREIGIRVALGAENRDVMHLLLGQGLRLTAIGIVLGTALAATAARLISGLLLGVTAVDPVAFAGSVAVFALVALGATYIPARRALAVQPMTALRSE